MQYFCFLSTLLVFITAGWDSLSNAQVPSGRQWPSYRHDAERSAYTSEKIPAPVAPEWVFRLPHPPRQAWVGRDTRMDWDASPQPVAAAGKVFFGCTVEDRIVALDATTGKEVWSFFTGGPVRFAPCFSGGRLYAVSDDGYLYCLDASNGTLHWKHRGGADDTGVFGNDRLISRWPARGAPFVSNRIVYFGAGIWPSDGIYIHALDARSGKPVWCNDSSGHIYMGQPHGGADSWSGISAQGYLLRSDEKLLVPTGRAVPAVLDLKTGAFENFLLQANTSGGGGILSTMPDLNAFWANGRLYSLPGQEAKISISAPHAVTPKGVVHVHRGTLCLSRYHWTDVIDRKGNTKKSLAASEANGILDVEGAPSVVIVAGNHAVLGQAGKIVVCDLGAGKIVSEWKVNGTVRGLAYADGNLFAATDAGEVYCLRAGGTRKSFQNLSPRPRKAAPEKSRRQGFAVVLGGGNLPALERLIQSCNREVLVLDEDAKTIELLRRAWSEKGWYGTIVTACRGDLRETPLPTRCADLVVDNGTATPPSEITRLLKPHGQRQSSLSSAPQPAGRPVTGGGNWTHPYHDPGNSLCSKDTLVKGPLGARWFRDLNLVMPNREGRSSPPLYRDGRLFVEGRDELLCLDGFTGRELWRLSLPGIQAHMDQSHYSGAYTGGNLCMDDKHLYMVDNDRCLRIRQDTGKIVARHAVPAPGKGWGYVATLNGRLYGSVADTDFHVRWLWSRSDMSRIYTESRSLFAMDPVTGKVLWKYKAKHSMRHNAIAVTDKSVFLIDRPFAPFDSTVGQERRKQDPGEFSPEEHPPGILIALDPATGQRQWSKEDDIYGTALMVGGTPSTLLMSYSRSGIRLSSEFGGKMRAYDPRTGDVRWDVTDLEDNRSRPILRSESIVVEPYAYDIRTGNRIADIRINRTYGCGIMVGSPHLLLFRSGTLGYLRTGPNREVENFGGMRPGCWFNFVPGDGMVFVPEATEGCSCSYLIKCGLALEERVDLPETSIRTEGKNTLVTVRTKENAIVRYTLDETPPVVESPQASEEVAIPLGGVLRLKAFRHGMAPSRTVIIAPGQ